jgi:hypothetical protein
MASIWYDGRRYPLAEQHVAQVRQQILDSADAGNAFWLDVYGSEAPKPTWLLVGPGVPLALHDWDDEKESRSWK